MDLIAWLLTSAKASPEATDLGGRKPGEADLLMEASSLKPTSISAKISGALSDARMGKSRGSTTATPSKTATAAPAVASSLAAAPSRPGRPTTTLAAARAAAAAKSTSKATSPTASTVKPGSHFAVPSPVKNAFSPAKTASPTRTPSPSQTADPAWGASPRGSPGRASPSRVAARAAALAEKTGAVSTAGPSSSAAVPEPTSPSAGMAAMSLDPDPSAPVSSVTVGTGPPTAYQASPSSPQRTAERAALSGGAGVIPAISVNSPRSAEASHSPWFTKPRAGGVHPRTGGGLPVTASSAQPGSPAAKTAAAAAAVTSATTAPAPAPVGGSGGRPSISKEPAYRPRSATASAPRGAPAAAAANAAIDPPSAPASHFQRPGASPTATAAAGSGSAAAVISASHGPKASALAAAFENKARERDTTAAPARQIRRGNSGLNSSGTAAKAAPALASTWGGTADSGGRPAAKVPAKRTTPPQVPHVAAAAPRPTPESLLGKGTVMHRKQASGGVKCYICDRFSWAGVSCGRTLLLIVQLICAAVECMGGYVWSGKIGRGVRSYETDSAKGAVVVYQKIFGV